MSKRLDKPLVRDEDYIVTTERPIYRRSADTDSFRASRSAIEVYAPAISEEPVYLCRECEAYVSDTVQGIHSHQRVHRNAEKKVVSDQTVLRSIAFGLLPEKVQAGLLAKARKIVGAS